MVEEVPMIYVEGREYTFIPGRLVQGTFRTAHVRTGGSSPGSAGVITPKGPHSSAREESACCPSQDEDGCVKMSFTST